MRKTNDTLHFKATHYCKDHALCGNVDSVHLLDEEAFLSRRKDVNCCQECLSNKLQQQLDKAKKAYEPEFIVSDALFAELSTLLRKDLYQVYTSVVMARRQLDEVNITGALEHLSIDCDKPFCQNESLISDLLNEYREYKEELAYFEKAFR